MEKIYDSDESFYSEKNQNNNTLNISPLKTEKKPGIQHDYFEEDGKYPNTRSKHQKILNESAQCVSLCDSSYKNGETSKSSKFTIYIHFLSDICIFYIFCLFYSIFCVFCVFYYFLYI